MFNGNPYRILGVLSTTGAKAIQKNLSKIKAYSKIGKHVSLPYELNFFNIIELNRSDSLIIEAENKILLDINKIKHSLFWFVNSSSIDQVALENLDKGNFEKSESIWRNVIKTNPISKSNIYAFNNLSTLLFLKSLSNKKNDSFENSNKALIQIKEALNLKGELMFSNYLELFCELICDNKKIISKEQILEFFNESINLLFNDNFSKVKVSKIISDSNTNLADSFNSSLVKEPINSLTDLLADSNEQLKEDNYNDFEIIPYKEIGRTLIEKSKNDLKLLLDILGKNNIKYQSISDKLANQIMQCGILCFNKTGEDFEYLNSYKYAKSISIKDSTKERATITIKHCEEEIKGKVCVFCNSNDISKINSLKVQMHKMNWDNTYSYFKNGGVEVSACRSCSSSLNNNKMIANILAFIITAGITALSSGIFIVIDLFLGFLMTKGIFWGVKFEMYIKKLEKHPSISKLKLENYKYGLP